MPYVKELCRKTNIDLRAKNPLSALPDWYCVEALELESKKSDAEKKNAETVSNHLKFVETMDTKERLGVSELTNIESNYKVLTKFVHAS